MPINLSPGPDPNRPRKGRPPGRVRRFLGWAFNPGEIFGTAEVRENAQVIRAMIADLRRGPSRRRAPVTEDGAYDVRAMAFLAGTTVDGILVRMAATRLSARRSCFIYTVIGVLLLVDWLWRAFTVPPAGLEIIYAVVLLAVALWFFVLAFFKAYHNWQLRIGRPAPIRSFLATEDSWLPR